tara:strand:+ start:653 stop:1102 length:450 start_codon:yes stop_codon:yes gene_type:complete
MKRYFSMILVVFLSLVMISSGLNKIIKYGELPNSNMLIEKYSNNSVFENIKEEGINLKYNNYKFGLQQSGYFWQLLGLCEFIFGLLLLFKKTVFFGALMLLSITLNIFLLHLFLQPYEVGELLYSASLLAINLFLVLRRKELLYSMFKI